ncbi:hypothetical protein MRB53_018610 [Persea americana]|uniref:Uncharacterized protein n=1 Tax=Persea americana TaxID=3435 RepID=A0ACC2M9A6_PERAE|nr:hypothetical protein MRB53_018610 [Persea americana]
MVEKQTGRKVKKLKTGNGNEYRSTEFENYCTDHNIVQHYTITETPQQNGVAKRMNRMILERARCMLFTVGLSKDFWAEAVNAAGYLINRSPHTKIGCKTPEEMWSGNPTDYSNLRIFGCPTYAHAKTDQLEPRAVKCILVGYDSGVKGYRLWCTDQDSPRLIISRDVTFHEDALLELRKQVERTEVGSSSDTVQMESDILMRKESASDSSRDTGDRQTVQQMQQIEPQMLQTGRQQRERKPPVRYGFEDMTTYASTSDSGRDDMVAYALTTESLELMEGLESSQHAATITKEMQFLDEEDKAIGCKRLYEEEEGASGAGRVQFKVPNYVCSLKKSLYRSKQASGHGTSDLVHS